MNKETIDEVAERLFNQVKGGITSVSAFKKGAKWERENSNVDVLEFEIATLKSLITDMDATIKSKYSEEEVNEIISESWNSCEDNEGETFTEVRKRIIEQFKKK
jgi:DNA-binding ferritin-like protein